MGTTAVLSNQREVTYFYTFWKFIFTSSVPFWNPKKRLCQQGFKCLFSISRRGQLSPMRKGRGHGDRVYIPSKLIPVNQQLLRFIRLLLTCIYKWVCNYHNYQSIWLTRAKQHGCIGIVGTTSILLLWLNNSDNLIWVEEKIHLIPPNDFKWISRVAPLGINT